jgi:hypothetical protein
MDISERDHIISTLGQVTQEPDDLPTLLGPNGQPVTGVKYVWAPPALVAQHLPEGFTFPMRCVVGPDGLRRFYPSSFEGQIAFGFAGGLAVLAVVKNLSPAQRYSYRAMHQLFGRVRRTREHLGNALLNPTSLRVSRVGRDVADERSILPAALGLDAQGEGELWGVDRLLREGRAAARAAGVQSPTEEDCVHHGFTAAARRNPLSINDEEVPPLVRMALYESIPGTEMPDRDLLDLIVERTLTAMHSHLMEPANDFERWFSGPKNSFVQQIARRKLLPGGVLDRDLVRRALLELGWQSHGYVADCLHVMMRVFQTSLPAPLSADEASWYEHMHLKQPYLGNLPLVLLIERFPFLHSVLWEIWNNPGDPEPIAVLHRLLSYYGEMAEERRTTDRKVKQRRPSTPEPGDRTPLVVPLQTEASSTDFQESPADEDGPEDEPDTGVERSASGGATAEVFANLAEMVRESRRVRCGCAVPAWDDRVVSQDENAVTIDHVCASCGLTARSTLPLEELKGMVRGVWQEPANESQ